MVSLVVNDATGNGLELIFNMAESLHPLGVTAVILITKKPVSKYTFLNDAVEGVLKPALVSPNLHW